MAGKKVNRLIVPNVYTVNGVEPVTSVNNILPVNGNVTIPIPTVPTNVSAFTNDAGYLTSATLDGYATQAWVRQQGYLTSIPSQYITDTELSTTLADYVTNSSLSTTLNSYATVTSLSTETSNRMDADDSLQSQINDKYDASNPDGFISGISRSDVITALGYTPYNSSNPNGYITSAALSDYVTNTDLSTTLADYAQTTDIPTVGNGTITINQGGVQKGTFTTNQSGNTTIDLDAGGSSGTVDQTYDSTSANAQSGVAIAGAGFLQNTATGSYALTILGTAQTAGKGTNVGYHASAGQKSSAFGYYAQATGQYAEVFGSNSTASGNFSIIIGQSGTASGDYSIAIGSGASASANRAIQLGAGENSTTNSLQIGFSASDNYILLDGTTGLIPDARISSNIARTSAIPTVPTNISSFTNDSGYITGITSSDVTTALGYTPYNSSNPNGYTSNTGTVTSVNNSQPDASGNVTLSIPTVPTNVSAFTNDSGYQTSSDVNTAVTSAISTLLGNLYPVGSVYIGTQATCPLETLGIGTWQLVSSGRVLQGSDTNNTAGSTVNASLPSLTTNSQGDHSHNRGTMNISGGPLTVGRFASSQSNTSGALKTTSGTSRSTGYYGSTKSVDSQITLTASSNWTGTTNTTGAHTHTAEWTGHVGTTVQPDAYIVNIWERIA